MCRGPHCDVLLLPLRCLGARGPELSLVEEVHHDHSTRPVRPGLLPRAPGDDDDDDDDNDDNDNDNHAFQPIFFECNFPRAASLMFAGEI